MTLRQAANTDYQGWPAHDRAAWEKAIVHTPADFLDDCPRLAGWAPRTQKNAQYEVSALLRWVATTSPVPADGSLARIVKPDLLKAYIKSALASRTAATVSYDIWLLGGALRVFAPDQDWDWMAKLSRRIAACGPRQPTKPRPLVHAAELYRLGRQLIRESHDADSVVADPYLYQTGLVLTLLTVAPMRIANLASLEIDRHLRRQGEQWMIVLAATETKTRRADTWPIGTPTSHLIDQYLETVRPALLGQARNPIATARFWIGVSGRPIGDQVLRDLIAKTTRERLGLQINPHTFRTCAATTFALERPEDVLQTSALLGHASAQTTEKHYIAQQRQLVQHDYLQILHERSRRATPR